MRLSAKRLVMMTLLVLLALSSSGCWLTDLFSPDIKRKVGIENDSRFTIHTGVVNGKQVISDGCYLPVGDWFILPDRYPDGTWVECTFAALDPTVYKFHKRFKMPASTTLFHDIEVSAKIIIGKGVYFAMAQPNGQVQTIFSPGEVEINGRVVQLEEDSYVPQP